MKLLCLCDRKFDSSLFGLLLTGFFVSSLEIRWRFAPKNSKRNEPFRNCFHQKTGPWRWLYQKWVVLFTRRNLLQGNRKTPWVHL